MTLVFITTMVWLITAFMLHLVGKEYDGPDEPWNE